MDKLQNHINPSSLIQVLWRDKIALYDEQIKFRPLFTSNKEWHNLGWTILLSALRSKYTSAVHIMSFSSSGGLCAECTYNSACAKRMLRQRKSSRWYCGCVELIHPQLSILWKLCRRSCARDGMEHGKWNKPEPLLKDTKETTHCNALLGSNLQPYDYKLRSLTTKPQKQLQELTMKVKKAYPFKTLSWASPPCCTRRSSTSKGEADTAPSTPPSSPCLPTSPPWILSKATRCTISEVFLLTKREAARGRARSNRAS